MEMIVIDRKVGSLSLHSLQGEREETWDDMVKSLPSSETCFVVFDFEFTDAEKRKHAELLLITWYSPLLPIIKGLPNCVQ